MNSFRVTPFPTLVGSIFPLSLPDTLLPLYWWGHITRWAGRNLVLRRAARNEGPLRGKRGPQSES